MPNFLSGRPAIWAYLAGLLAVGAAALWQTHQLALAEAREAKLGRELSDLRLSLAQANESATRRAADAAEAVRNEYETRIAETEPLVERVVVRIRDRCVPIPSAHSGEGVPNATGVADGSAEGAGDDADDGFGEALGRDITYCVAELNRLRALQDWWRSAAF